MTSDIPNAANIPRPSFPPMIQYGVARWDWDTQEWAIVFPPTHDPDLVSAVLLYNRLHHPQYVYRRIIATTSYGMGRPD